MYGLSYLNYFFRAIWRVEFFTALLTFHIRLNYNSCWLGPASQLPIFPPSCPFAPSRKPTKKNPAAGTPVSYTQIGLNFQAQHKKNQFDNHANFRYLDDYSFRLIDASIC